MAKPWELQGANLLNLCDHLLTKDCGVDTILPVVNLKGSFCFWMLIQFPGSLQHFSRCQNDESTQYII